MDIIRKAYQSIRLNLGIKKFLKDARNTAETTILYPIHLKLEEYFFKRIVEYYGGDYGWRDEKSQNLNFSRHSLGYGLAHYAFVRNQKPKRILCVGSMYGFIPYMLARACKENRIGHVDFVDAGYDKRDKQNKDNHYFGEGFWKRVDPKKHFSYLGVSDYITSYIMTNSEFARKYKHRYDYMYFDADHSYKGALVNFRLFWSRLNKEGYVCLHDIHFDRTTGGVVFEHGKVWKKLHSMPFKFELSNHYSGLGFVQKLTDHNPLKYL